MKIDNDRREKLIAVLREAEHPLRAGDIAARIEDLNPYQVAATLRFIGDAQKLDNGRWWLRDRGDPPAVEPSRSPVRASQSSAIALKRRRFEEAVERLRSEGAREATVAQIASASGLHPISVGKFLGAGGYARLREVLRPDGRTPLWSLDPGVGERV